ncbi:hypothetical protein FXO38_20364 [Capsicum annuum]|nr:hypothetical protein FXO38_20364 [Capsicum annuum]
MANEDSPSFILRISQIETQKGVPTSNQDLDFTLGNFDYTEEDHDANVAQSISVQQQSERTAPTNFLHEFDDFSSLSNIDLLKKMRLDAGPSRARSEPHVFLDKHKVMHNVEMKDADNASAAGEKKESLSKLFEVVKEGFASYGKVAHYSVNESEKDIPNREGDPPQSLNEHNMDAKSENIVENDGQSSKVGGNEGGADKCLKEAESAYTDKVQEEYRHNTVDKIDEGIRDERLKKSEENLHNIDKDLSKAITMYVPPLPAAYLTRITDNAIATIDTCNLQGNTDSQSYVSDNATAAISQVPICKTNLSNIIKKPAKRNRQPSKLYQSPYANIYDSGLKDEEVTQPCKELNYSFEGFNIYGPYAEELFSKFSL